MRADVCDRADPSHFETMDGKAARSVELAFVFGLLPLALGWWMPPAGWVPALCLTSAVAGWRLRTGRSTAGNLPAPADAASGAEVRRIVLRWIGSGLLLACLVFRWDRPDWLFLPRERPGLWLITMVLYPVLSVYPQELLYRRFFFQRYQELLGGGQMMVLVSAAVFGGMHGIFRNETAVGLALIGGYFFAETYRRTGSLRLVCLEHALYGDLIFTIGLGRFLYHGAVKM